MWTILKIWSTASNMSPVSTINKLLLLLSLYIKTELQSVSTNRFLSRAYHVCLFKDFGHGQVVKVSDLLSTDHCLGVSLNLGSSHPFFL